MTITVQILARGATPATAGTQVGSQAIAAPASWTRLTTLGTIPGGGGLVTAISDAEPFRISIMDPVESTNTAGPMPTPRDNGVLVPFYGAGSGQTFDLEAGPNSQVWVKQA